MGMCPIIGGLKCAMAVVASGMAMLVVAEGGCSTCGGMAHCMGGSAGRGGCGGMPHAAGPACIIPLMLMFKTCGVGGGGGIADTMKGFTLCSWCGTCIGSGTCTGIW